MHCMRCGREIPENELLCAVCKLPPAISVPDAEPEQKSKKELRREAKAAKRREKAKKAADPKVVRRLALALTFTILLLIGTAFLIARHYTEYMERRSDLRVREASVALREQEAEKRDARIRELEDQLKEANKKISILEFRIASLEPEPR
ncbi:MAG: hypothetical protein Q3977_00515 [Oscillospiraceae bacterium]|nr:hypothetical protein [Oscillospiraceae bacterium]